MSLGATVPKGPVNADGFCTCVATVVLAMLSPPILVGIAACVKAGALTAGAETGPTNAPEILLAWA